MIDNMEKPPREPLRPVSLCPKCHYPVEDSASDCSHCGAKLIVPDEKPLVTFEATAQAAAHPEGTEKLPQRPLPGLQPWKKAQPANLDSSPELKTLGLPRKKHSKPMEGIGVILLIAVGVGLLVWYEQVSRARQNRVEDDAPAEISSLATPNSLPSPVISPRSFSSAPEVAMTSHSKVASLPKNAASIMVPGNHREPVLTPAISAFVRIPSGSSQPIAVIAQSSAMDAPTPVISQLPGFPSDEAPPTPAVKRHAGSPPALAAPQFGPF